MVVTTPAMTAATPQCISTTAATAPTPAAVRLRSQRFRLRPPRRLGNDGGGGYCDYRNRGECDYYENPPSGGYDSRRYNSCLGSGYDCGGRGYRDYRRGEGNNNSRAGGSVNGLKTGFSSRRDAYATGLLAAITATTHSAAACRRSRICVRSWWRHRIRSEKYIDYILIIIMFLMYWDFLLRRGGIPCVLLYLTTEFSALATLPSI